METTFRTISVALMGLFVAMSVAIAQDDKAEAVRQKIHEMTSQFIDGDFDAYFSNIAVGQRRFGPNGGPLTQPGTKESMAATARNLKANYEKGARRKVTIKSIDVQVFGSTAVASYLIEGDDTNANGETTHLLRRKSTVLIQEDGDWKAVHSHTSDWVSP